MSVSLRKVDLNLLNIFSELIKDPHLTNTAKRLNMTQPAVSMALQRLRSLYGDSLFIREGKKMKPTARALEIAPDIDKALALMKQTLPTNNSFDPTTANVHFRMNIFNYAEQLFAAEIVEKLQLVSPRSSLFISSEYMVDPKKLLRDRQTDIHFDYSPIIHSDFNSQEISRDELVIIARVDHPRLKDNKAISMAEYLHEKHAIVLSSDGTELLPENSIVNFDDIKSNRKVGYHGSSTLGVLSMVTKSDMITLIPKHLIKAINQYSEILQFSPPFQCKPFITYMSWYVGIQYEPSHQWFKQFLMESTQDYRE